MAKGRKPTAESLAGELHCSRVALGDEIPANDLKEARLLERLLQIARRRGDAELAEVARELIRHDIVRENPVHQELLAEVLA